MNDEIKSSFFKTKGDDILELKSLIGSLAGAAHLL